LNSKKLNILRISSTFVPPWRGLGPGPFELTNSQHEIGHNVTVITKHSEGCESFDGSLPYEVIRIKSGYDLIFSFKAMVLYFKIQINRPIDVIHNHGFSALWLILYKKIIGLETPIISSVHIVRIAQFFNVNRVDFSDLSWRKNNVFYKKFKRFKKSSFKTLLQEKIYLNYSDHLVTVSDSLTQEINFFYKKAAPVKPVYNGVNHHTFKAFNSKNHKKESNDIELIFVGAINKRKGEFDLINALSIINRSNVKLKIIGEGPKLKNLKNEIESLKLTNSVSLINNLPHQELIKHLEYADIFVLPSYSEGLPKVLLEAMITNNIIIVSDIGPHKSVINESTGVFFKTGDVYSLTNVLNDVVSNIKNSRVLATNAKQHVLDNYTWTSVAYRINSVYDSLINYK
jgi:glycosyltransferase involved in cell wall biosynthesis